MKSAKWVTLVALFSVWFVISFSLQNEVLLPMPQDVVFQMISDLQNPVFYSSVGITLYRMLKGLVFAFALGIAFGLGCGLSKWFDAFFYPLEVILKTVPNISYIILSLIWLGSEASVTVVSFLVLFPVVFGNVKQGILAIDTGYIDVIKVYPTSFSYKIRKVYLPLISPYLKAALQTSLGLGFKVSVMAEILGRVQSGIGFRLDFCRVNLDYTGVFAWTIWIVLLVVVLDNFMKIVSRKDG